MIQQRVFASTALLFQSVTNDIQQCAHAAIRRRGVFHLVLAGGGTPRGLYEHLARTPLDLFQWQFYFGDERCVPIGDARRNDTMAKEAWLDHVPVKPEQIHSIPAELGPERGAQRYVQTLEPIGLFDLVLLGLGEDGHTASLFPAQCWGTESTSPPALPVRNAPKPPPERVSLGSHRLSQARRVYFLVTGGSKREAAERLLTGKPIPAGAITAQQQVVLCQDESSAFQDSSARS